MVASFFWKTIGATPSVAAPGDTHPSDATVPHVCMYEYDATLFTQTRVLLRWKQNVRIIANMELFAAPCAAAACFCVRTVWPVATRNQRRRKVEKDEEIRGRAEPPRNVEEKDPGGIVLVVPASHAAGSRTEMRCYCCCRSQQHS